MRIIQTTVFFITFGLLSSASLQADSIEVRKFDSKAQELLYKKLIHKVRCITCANQTIGDSNATVAGSLRSAVYALIKQGKSESEIIDFLVARYGDYVVYEPPLKWSTLLIWFGPILLILFGLWFMRKLIKKQAVASTEDHALNEQEQARLQALLNDKDKP